MEYPDEWPDDIAMYRRHIRPATPRDECKPGLIVRVIAWVYPRYLTRRALSTPNAD